MIEKYLRIEDAHENNLKHLSCKIPLNQFVAVAGPSGSGKSSLVIDTIMREAEWRFGAPLTQLRNRTKFLVKRPQVEIIEGLPFTVLLSRIPSSKRISTFGMLTGVYEKLSALFYRWGHPSCLKCGEALSSFSLTEIVDLISRQLGFDSVEICAPVVGGGASVNEIAAQLRGRGFTRIRWRGDVHSLDEFTLGESSYESEALDIQVIVDLIRSVNMNSQRLHEAVDLALDVGDGSIDVHLRDESQIVRERRSFSTRLVCQTCGLEQAPITEDAFRFDIIALACKRCHGSGVEPLENDTENDTENDAEMRRCSLCHGFRIRKEASHYVYAKLRFSELLSLPVHELLHWGKENFQLRPERRHVVDDRSDVRAFEQVTKEGISLLQDLDDVGLGYLSLNRTTQTLSAGEIQRARLATYLGCGMGSMLLVLDEPSKGLHPRDIDVLIPMLRRVVVEGNSLIAIEHESQILHKADIIFELGPVGGRDGGYIINQGNPGDVLPQRSRTVSIENPRTRVTTKDVLKFQGVSVNNLREIDVELPLGSLVAVCGVSGSGKSSLVENVIFPLLSAKERKSDDAAKQLAPPLRDIIVCGAEKVQKTVWYNSQRHSSRRSTVATMTGVADGLRKLFAMSTGARIRGWDSGKFSFNSREGRCEVCEGYGEQQFDDEFNQGAMVVCERCHGSRFSLEILSVTFNGLSIADYLSLDVASAFERLGAIPYLAAPLSKLLSLGLGYIRLSECSTSLSTGEYQRVSLAPFLSGAVHKKTLFLLDEPTSGLHYDEVKRLTDVLHALVTDGHSVLVIEHNLDMLRSADYLIELGPGAGDGGGKVIAFGTPREVKSNRDSIIANYL